MSKNFVIKDEMSIIQNTQELVTNATKLVADIKAKIATAKLNQTEAEQLYISLVAAEAAEEYYKETFDVKVNFITRYITHKNNPNGAKTADQGKDMYKYFQTALEPHEWVPDTEKLCDICGNFKKNSSEGIVLTLHPIDQLCLYFCPTCHAETLTEAASLINSK